MSAEGPWFKPRGKERDGNNTVKLTLEKFEHFHPGSQPNVLQMITTQHHFIKHVHLTILVVSTHYLIAGLPEIMESGVLILKVLLIS